MFKPAPMQKVRIIGLRAELSLVCSFLQKAGVIDLAETKSELLAKESPLEYFDAVSAQLVRIRGIKAALGSAPMPPSPMKIDEPLELASALTIDEPVRAANGMIEEGKKKIAHLSSQIAELEDLRGFDIDFSALYAENLDFYVLRFGKKDQKAIGHKLSTLTHEHNLAVASAKGTALVGVLAIRSGVEAAKALEGIAACSALPKISNKPTDAILGLKQGIYAAQQQIAEGTRQLEAISSKYYPILIMLEEALQIEADCAAASTQFARTDRLFFAEGWVRKEGFGDVEQSLHGRFGKKVMMQRMETGHEEVPPTLLENPSFAGPFEFLVKFLSLPQATEIDPTLIILFTIPLFYALIMGDAGYGLLSLLLAGVMIWKTKKGSFGNAVGRIWAICAIPTIIFGIIFDEYFAFGHVKLLSATLGIQQPLYEGFHRLTRIQDLMFFVLLIGMVHIGFGFILGAINEWNHSRKHAYAKIAWLGIEISGVFLVATFFFSAFAQEVGIASAALFAVCAGVLLWAEGISGVFEIPGLSSNIMSYLRIAAVGVGSVIIAEAINELLLPTSADFSTIGGIIVFVLMALMYALMHFTACALAMFESLVHGARLNVVEFYGKFYKGNGKEFSPFAEKRVYTRE
jgi:V/A-type H+/Na+-transporting ATPase subunit I